MTEAALDIPHADAGCSLDLRAASSILLVVAILLSGCVTDRILIENDTRVDATQFRRVEDTTARLRRLPFVEDVPADVMTVAQLRDWFDQYADARKADLAKEDRFYHRTGILPPTVSTAEAYKGFLADFVGGVYDDSRKRMILVSDYAWWSKVQQDAIGMITGVDWAYEVFLVHELVHALQDQHFGLGEMLRGGVYDDNDDAAFVRKTILETEANVAGMAHFLGMDLEQLATRKSFFLFLRYNNLLNGPLLLALSGNTPSFFAKQALTQYELGLNFVERRLDLGGYDELSRAYLREPGTPGALPESTEQLLYPRKMRREALDRPVYFKRLDAGPTTLSGSSLILTNVFGALAFRHWFERIVGPLEGPAVADGWGGDRYDLVDDAGHTVLIWRTTWDSDDDAGEFLNVYSRGVARRYGERAKEIERSDDVARFAIPAAPEEDRLVRTKRDEVVWIERRGRDVLIVDGAAPDTARALTDEMWTMLVPVPAPTPDAARLAQRAERLEQHLTELPRKAPKPDLLGRLFLPARTMAVRAGTGFGVIPDTGVDGVFPLADGEARWGFRPHLEIALPLALSGEFRTFLGQTVVGAAPRFIPELDATLHLGHAIAIGEPIVVVGQLGVQRAFDSAPVRTAAIGALLQPFEQLVLAPSVARIEDPLIGDSVALGGALLRGFSSQPLIELEVVDGLFLYENTFVLCALNEKGLSLRAHSHVMGVMLYF